MGGLSESSVVTLLNPYLHALPYFEFLQAGNVIVRLGRWASLWIRVFKCCTSLENSVDSQLRELSVCLLGHILTHLCLMEFPTYIDWTNPF